MIDQYVGAAGSVASSVAVQNTTAVIQYNTVYYGTVIGTVLDSKNLYARLIRPYVQGLVQG
jgi:hypothetical protein